jgi:arabinan endo-1,5-alpha-L-arabinosidase
MKLTASLCVWLGAVLAPLACGSEELPGSSNVPVGEAGANSGNAGASAQSGAAGNVSGGSEAAAGTAQVEGGAPVGGAPPSHAGQGSGGEPTPAEPAVLALTGAVTQVHDPAIVKDGDTFYLFSTGQGISVRTSKDLLAWKGAGSVFASKPSWITTTASNDPNHLWAPEVRYFGGKFHLYYSASKFGSNQSCIGHATRASLGSGAGWVDQGQALICSNASPGSDDFNAIDPNPFEDEAGKLWLSFGSFWGGIKLIRLDLDGRRDGPDLFSLATRANTAVEAPHLHFHGGYYYLFESVDACCQGANSTYKIMVGRAKSVSGPFIDADGEPLAGGAGSLVLQGAGRWRGPGHNAILVDQGQTYNVYHSYDAESAGTPNLRIAEMTWSDDGWPVSAGP